jgi:DNA-3-methyladenine glycosylase II
MTTHPTFSITPAGPFSWERASDFLANFAATSRHGRGRPAVRMAFPLDGDLTPVGVGLHWDAGALHGVVTGTADVDAARDQVARIFSLDVDATDYPAVGEREPAVGRLMSALPGLRPILFTSPYECAAWAIMSQRISRVQAARVQERLLAELGDPLEVGGEVVRCFPAPERLAELRDLPGLSAEKVRRLRELAAPARAGLLDAARLRALGPERAPAELRRLAGIGEWWSQGIYLRACGVTDVFAGEPIAIRALTAVRGLAEPPGAAELEALTEVYRPFRMWVCVLLRVAVNRGLVPGVDDLVRTGRLTRPVAARSTAARRAGA